MATKTYRTFAERVNEARKAAAFALVVDENTVVLPGHDGKQYQVVVERGDGVVACSCSTIWPTFEPCPSRFSRNNICYHGIAAVIALATEAKVKVAVADVEPKARKLANLGARAVVRIEPFENVDHTLERKVGVWAVVR